MTPINRFAQLELQCMQVASGLNFHYVESGHGATLLFIHGGAGDYTSAACHWPEFDSDFRLISYSRRFSQPNTNPVTRDDHSVNDEVTDLVELMDAWGVERPIIVASSYGALIALTLATLHPNKVKGLLLVEPALLSWANLTPKGRLLREQFAREVEEPAREAFLSGDDLKANLILSGGIVGPTDTSDLSTEKMRTRLRNSLAMKVNLLTRSPEPTLDPADVSSLKMPILLVSGENTQPLLGEVFSTIARAIPSAEVVVVSDSGHSVTRDQPLVFNQICRQFLSRHPLLSGQGGDSHNSPDESFRAV